MGGQPRGKPNLYLWIAREDSSCRQRVGKDSPWPETSLGACRDDTRPRARHRRRQGGLVRVPTRTWWERRLARGFSRVASSPAPRT